MAIPNHWRTKKQRYSLHGDVCMHCQQAVFPPRGVCPHCHRPMHGAAQESQPVLAVNFAFPTVSAQQAMPAVVGDD
ncbi:MAG: hypothetical protein IPK16_16995 [Anaerolineales bacterium]|nr:hypothetical protein [Anaerolineales bacterium]